MVDAGSASLFARCRTGDLDARGELLALCRDYLKALARARIDKNLRVRCDDSDLVQETLLEAQRDFSRFVGATEKELHAWLRRILVRNLADQVKRHKARARNWQRQESLESLIDHSCQAVQIALAQGTSSPSAQACRREESLRLADALARLPGDYREVIVLRHVQNLAFDQVATRMGRSAGATRMLWARALEKLQTELATRC